AYLKRNLRNRSDLQDRESGQDVMLQVPRVNLELGRRGFRTVLPTSTINCLLLQSASVQRTS
ncbi:hypothetical protein J6590_098276, partial [Homalodisca vitripennis]